METTDTFFQEQVGLQAFDGIQLDHFTRVRFFLKNGMNPNMRDSQKRTLLMCSCNVANERTALRFVNLLLKHKARIELADINGLNALHHAVLCGHKKVVARFLEFSGNFDLNGQDNEGNTALMLAALTKNFVMAEQIIQVLRRYDLSVDISNKQGITPLIQATMLGENEISKCLIVLGKASEQIRDKHFRKSASEWERMGAKRDRLPNSYPTKNRALHTYPPLCYSYPTRNRGIHTSPSLSHSYPTKNRGIHTSSLQYPYKSPIHLLENRRDIERLPELSHSPTLMRYFPESSASADNYSAESYKWPDLKRVYDLYGQELASSYRKSALPRRKSPPPPSSDSSSEGTLSWRKTALRMKQRRHTIALSRSLPNNLSTKFLFSRRNIPELPVGGRSLSVGNSDQAATDHFKSSPLRHSRRNSLRRFSDTRAPYTAPGELGSSLPPKADLVRRNSTSSEKTPRMVKRNSVSFQSFDLDEDNGTTSALYQSPQTRRSSLKYTESGFRKVGERNLPIFEQEEDSAKIDIITNDDDDNNNNTK